VDFTREELERDPLEGADAREGFVNISELEGRLCKYGTLQVASLMLPHPHNRIGIEDRVIARNILYHTLRNAATLKQAGVVLTTLSK
jgi:hypothetical protein